MNFTGLTYRFFTASNSGNFLFNSLSSSAVEIISGSSSFGKEMRIGFTGITGNTNWYFSFLNGKIYDPEGRCFGAFDETSINSISGNFDSGSYNYYLNDVLINAQGVKETNDFNGWFVECISGASGKADVFYTSAPINTSFYMQSGFYIGGIWSGSFTNNHSKPLVIRSGLLLSPDSIYFAITGTGLDFNAGLNVIPSGGNRTVRLSHTGQDSPNGVYTLGVRIYTDYGFSDFIVSGSGVPYRDGFISNGLSPATGQNIVSEMPGSGVFSYNYSTIYQNSQGTPQEKPFSVSLTYLSGYTGSFYPVTGLSITNNGNGFTSDPLIYITPTGLGQPFASGSGIRWGGTGENVTGVNWYQSGVYTGNTGTCAVVCSEGGGQNFASQISWGTTYNKAWNTFVSGFSGVFGTGGSPCTGDSTNIYGAGTLTSGEDLLTYSIVFNGTPDNLSLQYLFTVSGLPDTTSGISMYSGSGFLI